jgi:uncharacterized protein (DUF302 family)
MKQHIVFSLFLFLALSVTAKENSPYIISKTVSGTFEEVSAQVESALGDQGFGIISTVNLDKSLKKHLEGVEMKPYRILGACNPSFAYQLVQEDDNIGLFLPCKVIIKQLDDTKVEVVMMEPTGLMKELGKNELVDKAQPVTDRLQMALDAIGSD